MKRNLIIWVFFIFMFLFYIGGVLGSAINTLSLQTPNTQNLGDTWVDGENPATNHGNDLTATIFSNKSMFVMFNISSLPAQSDILTSNLRIASGVSFDFSMEAYHVYNHSWTEGTLVYNNNPCGLNFADSSQCNQTRESEEDAIGDGFHNFNIINALLTEYNDGHSNVSIRINSSFSATSMYTKEQVSATGLRRPLLTITYYSPTPAVSLNSPSNNSAYSSSPYEVTFNCSASVSSYRELTNISIYGNWNGTWALNETKLLEGSGVENSTTFIKNISEEGTYLWNCKAINNASTSSFATNNYTISIDLTPPTINITSPINGSTDLEQTVDVLYNFNDSHESKCWYSNNSGITNHSLTNCANITTVTWSSGTTNLTIWGNDTAGNIGSNWIYFTVDNTNPIVNNTQIYTTAGSQTFTFSFNASDTHLSSCWYSVYNSTGGIDSATTENTSVSCNSAGNSETVSDYGIYNLTIWANDTIGNIGSNTTSFTISPSTGGGGTGGGISSITFIEAKNFSITTTNLLSQMDIALAKDSVRPRSKDFVITNTGIEPITVNIYCDTVGINQTIQGIDICDYVDFSNTTFIVEPSSELRSMGKVYVLTPENSSYDDIYYFNIIAEYDDGTTKQFSKLSVSGRVSLLATLYKWSFFPFQDESLGSEEKIKYPVFGIALAIAFIIFTLIFFLFKRSGLDLTGFFLGITLAIISIILIVFVF